MNAHRRSVFGLLLIAVFILTFSASAFSQDSEGVQIVNGKDGVGQAQSIPTGVFQVDGKQLAQNVSVKVSNGYFVQFCAQKDGTGRCEAFGEGVHNLTWTEFNFIKVGKGPVPTATSGTAASNTAPVASGAPGESKAEAPVTVFEQKNWGGRSQVFFPGMYRSYRGEFGKINDNQAMSIIVAKGYKVRLCVDEGMNFRGAGDCEFQEEGRNNLRFANSISFIEVIDLNDKSPADEKMPVVLYEDSGQSGKMQGFDEGTFLGSKGEFKKLGNDQASSISVKSGYHAMVCADEPVSGGEPGGCEEFTSGKKNIKAKKAVSYLKVWKE